MANHILNEQTFYKFRQWSSSRKELAIDTETTGLRLFHGDHAFAVVVADGEDAWFWDASNTLSLPNEIADLFLEEDRVWIGHNIRFDYHAVEQTFGSGPRGKLYCTAIGARVEYNDHASYDLDACLKRIGKTKQDKVMLYIKENGLKTREPIPYKDTTREILHFDKVPLDIMIPYACDDARGAFHLYKRQIERIQYLDSLNQKAPPSMQVVKLEQDLLPVVIKMEREGILINPGYCKEAIEYLSDTMEKDKRSYQELTGRPYKSSPKEFQEIFQSDKLRWGRTEKGNPSFGSDVLETFEHPAAKLVVGLRNAKSRRDFFATFLSEADSNNLVHPSFNSGGTATRRFSSSGPNFQNLTNDEESEEKYSPRKALIPPDNCFILSADYKQQEYMLMLDYAGQMDVIEQVRRGADLHQATADMMGVSRKQAKCIAEGSLVLTDRGLVEIQNVRDKDLVWDGQSFVYHSGVICQGKKEVIEYAGLRATPDHKVYTECGRFIPLQEAAENGFALAQTEAYGVPLRFPSDNIPPAEKGRGFIFWSRVWGVRQKALDSSQQLHARENNLLQMSEEPEAWNGASPDHKPSVSLGGNESEMQQPERQKLQELRWAWNPVSLYKKGIIGILAGKFFNGRSSNKTDRSNKQQWSLRARQYSNEHPLREPKKSTAKVYDILNAGPNFRFTVSGKLVSNCLNFQNLYGGGVAKLAAALFKPTVDFQTLQAICFLYVYQMRDYERRQADLDLVNKIPQPVIDENIAELQKAKALRDMYFDRLPKVKEFIQRVIATGESRGNVYNWAGMRYWCNRRYSYVLPNRVIQGGGAEIGKFAMVGINAALEKARSRLFLPVHDELDFYIRADEQHLCGTIKEIMEKVYPPKHLPMRVDLSHSWRSLGELEEGVPA